MRKTPTNILEQLQGDEDERLKPYRDNSKQIGFEGKQGKLTIGIGRNLDDDGITDMEAVYLANNDIARVTAELRIKLPWVDDLDEVRFGVLQNMGFNMGVGGLLGFREMLGWLNRNPPDFSRAAAEMADSAWYHEVGPRAARLVEQMLTGKWQ